MQQELNVGMEVVVNAEPQSEYGECIGKAVEEHIVKILIPEKNIRGSRLCSRY